MQRAKLFITQQGEALKGWKKAKPQEKRA